MDNDGRYKSQDLNSQENGKAETANRIDELTSLVEHHTRTERHLEQYSDIGSKDNVEHAREVQKEREEQIANLKEKIINGDGGATDEIEGLKKNITFGEGYMNHNADHMNKEDLENLRERQHNRKDTLDRLQGE